MSSIIKEERGSPNNRADEKERLLPKKSPVQATTMASIIWGAPKVPLLWLLLGIMLAMFGFYVFSMSKNDYLRVVMNFDEETHNWASSGLLSLAYGMGLVGAVLSDGCMGKFRTISLIYPFLVAASSTLAWSASSMVHETYQPALDIVALVLIYSCHGALRPVVYTFFLEQFHSYEKKMIFVFTPFIYADANIGAIFAAFVFPPLNDVKCFHNKACYPATFGVAATCMAIGFCCFLLGIFHYRTKVPTNNVIMDGIRITIVAIKNKAKGMTTETPPDADEPSSSNSGDTRHTSSKVPKKLLDNYMTTHSCDADKRCLEEKNVRGNPSYCQKLQFIEDLHVLYKFSMFMVPMAIWWASYYTIQDILVTLTVETDGDIGGSLTLTPEHLYLLSGVLVLIATILVYGVVYPIIGGFTRLNYFYRLYTGLALMCIALYSAYYLAEKVERSAEPATLPQRSYIYVISDGCVPVLLGQSALSIDPQGSRTPEFTNHRFDVRGKQVDFQLINDTTCPQLGTLTYDVDPGTAYVLNLEAKHGVSLLPLEATYRQNVHGEAGLQVMVTIPNYKGNVALCSEDTPFMDKHPCDPANPGNFFSFENDADAEDVLAEPYQQNSTGRSQVLVFHSKGIRPGYYTVYLFPTPVHEPGADHDTPREDFNVTSTGFPFRVNKAGKHDLMIISGNSTKPNVMTYVLKNPNKTPILHFLVPAILVSFSEAFFTITLLEMSFVEASPELRTTFLAISYVPALIGNLSNTVISKLGLYPLKSQGLLSYGGACSFTFLIYIIMGTRWYKHQKRPYDETASLQEPITEFE